VTPIERLVFLFFNRPNEFKLLADANLQTQLRRWPDVGSPALGGIRAMLNIQGAVRGEPSHLDCLCVFFHDLLLERKFNDFSFPNEWKTERLHAGGAARRDRDYRDPGQPAAASGPESSNRPTRCCRAAANTSSRT
jgi:hypothetical protein